MAIQISGTTVIDNSRNICNAVNGTFSGNVCANCFIGNGIGLSNVGTDPKIFFISARK
jgi:hypothetical protein